MMFYLLTTLLLAQEIPDLHSDGEIIVEAHKNYEVYIAPVQYHVHDESIEAILPYESVFMHASNHSRLSKVPIGAAYEPITMHGGMKVYNEDTISYVWDQCDYKKDHRKCAFTNDHYFLETHVTVDKNELTVSMSLFDSSLQIVNSSIISDKKAVKWVRQQEISSQTAIVPSRQQSVNDCDKADEACQSISQSGQPIIITNVSTPKEELPLKLEIPHKLMSGMIYQVSIRLWTGAKL
jgi:hypothetical protein